MLLKLIFIEIFLVYAIQNNSMIIDKTRGAYLSMKSVIMLRMI